MKTEYAKVSCSSFTRNEMEDHFLCVLCFAGTCAPVAMHNDALSFGFSRAAASTKRKVQGVGSLFFIARLLLLCVCVMFCRYMSPRGDAKSGESNCSDCNGHAVRCVRSLV